MEFDYRITGCNHTIDEQGNSFIALREIAWNDKQEPRLDIRKYRVDKEGNEVINKGVSFLTPEGPACLAYALLQEGYGDTKEIINNIKDREDFMPALVQSLSPDQLAEVGIDPNTVPVDAYYDPAQMFNLSVPYNNGYWYGI